MFTPLARLNGLYRAEKTILRNLRNAVKVMPEVININRQDSVRRATEFVLSGQVIAVPTDTIYGLAASAFDKNACQQLYDIKKRDARKPVAICVEKVADVQYWGETSHLQESLLESLLPGPVTVVLNKKGSYFSDINQNTNLVGIRVPEHWFVGELIKMVDGPLALTSANLSTEPSAIHVREFSHIWPYLGAIFDGGCLGSNRAGSTVVDLSEPGFFTILRPGIAFEETLLALKKFDLKEQF